MTMNMDTMTTETARTTGGTLAMRSNESHFTTALTPEDAARELGLAMLVQDTRQATESVVEARVYVGASRQLWELDVARCSFARVR
jgi:hypothetical protein